MILTFDVMGTLVNWHAGMSRVFTDQLGPRTDSHFNWSAVVNHYRAISLDRVRGLVAPEHNFDVILANVLHEVAREYGLILSSEQAEKITEAWVSLPVWEDVLGGLGRLKSKHKIVPFTVLSRSSLDLLAAYHGIEWDDVVSCESLHVYKPRQAAYRAAADYLRSEPESITMVACHDFDLRAAAGCGFKTAYVDRPDEWGGLPGYSQGGGFDYQVASLDELAEQLGC